jgi:Kef-type K+ transport system membrane component KefB/mannitol/fructose-specific phosphotransferase system IIA component (Ntr-type)
MSNFKSLSLPVSDPVLIVAIVMLIILISPMVFKKMRIPGIVGIILSGTIVGPSLTGLLERDATIILLGTVGLLYLMFMAGLSIDLNQFNKLRNKSISFGFISFSLPLGLSLYFAPLLIDYPISTALLLGSIVGSHTLLAYPIAHRLGITKNSAVTMTMGGTIITDSLSLALLAIVVGALSGGLSLTFLGAFGTSVAIFLAVSFLVIPRMGRWFFKTFPKENDTDYIFLMAVLFVNAWFADIAGLAPIIGAFLAGLTLNKLVPESSPLMNRVQFVGNALFIPFFLISVGMLVDVSKLVSLEVWYYALIFSSMVFIGKFIASMIAKLIFKHSFAEGMTIFGLSTPQAAATLAVTLIGFDLGIFNEVSVNAVVIMILVTCLVGPYFVEKYGRIIAANDSSKPYLKSDAPQRILVPLANPTTAEALMDIAFAMRDKNSSESVYPLTVVRDGTNVEVQVAESEKMLSHAVIYASGADVPVNPVTRVDMNISNGISRAIKEMRITNIIIGWNGESSARQRIFGGVLDQLLEQSDEMIMVCKIEEKINTNEHIVLAIPPFASLEPGFAEAIRYIKILANQMGADLHVIGVTDRIDRLKASIKNMEPEVPTKFVEIPSWINIIDKLDSIVTPDSLLILQSAREGTISWRPGLDRLPGLIANRFKDVNFISVFPSESNIDNIHSGQHISFNPLHAIVPKNIQIGVDDDSIQEIVRQLLQNEYGNDEQKLEVLANAILDNSLEYTPEIIPGTAIFDAHTELVDSTQIFIGINKEGLKIPKASGPINLLILVLNPEFIGTDGHFTRLNAIAKLFRSQTFSTKISEMKDPNQVAEFLREEA